MNTEKIDQTVLALLSLTLHNDGRAWKSFDWNVLNRLHEKGMILNPVNKAKSVVLTDEGIAESARLFAEMFGSDDAAPHDAIDAKSDRATP